jgi:hypothetical protein
MERLIVLRSPQTPAIVALNPSIGMSVRADLCRSRAMLKGVSCPDLPSAPSEDDRVATAGLDYDNRTISQVHDMSSPRGAQSRSAICARKQVI